ncbi:MAG: RnfABCDGE type electron transport complex subunit D [Oscillospiraceae bacterium]|jgi:electron transport complex protein RnfD|nr:RnfABCDGE type electron transport complex subunit D [Oscillospiraceae bacterium]
MADNNKRLLTVSPSPHIRSSATVPDIMTDVVIALAPSLIAGVWIFGYRAFVLTAVAVLSCFCFELAFDYLVNGSFSKNRRKPSVCDCSFAVTGMLLAFSVPPTLPVWQLVVGSLFAIVVVKMLFGGIGRNFANPAVTARIFLFLAFSGAMTKWTFDGVVTATPLAGGTADYFTLFLGTHAGCIGETSAAALLVGGLYLIVRRVISWETPVFFILSAAALSSVFGIDPLFTVLSGGMLLGAIFMATDYTTSPINFWGRAIFGAGCGILTVVFRKYSNNPEGVSFAILLMNILTPYIDRAVRPRAFGEAKRK